jgi:6-phosphogluconolactonase
VSVVRDTGSGPNPRQAGPHVHDVVIAPGGRFALIADFGADRVLVRRFDRTSRVLSALVQRIPCGGLTPWSFSLHRSGRWLLVANEASGSVGLFGVDPRSGRLTDTGTSIPVPNPACITFDR